MHTERKQAFRGGSRKKVMETWRYFLLSKVPKPPQRAVQLPQNTISTVDLTALSIRIIVVFTQ